MYNTQHTHNRHIHTTHNTWISSSSGCLKTRREIDAYTPPRVMQLLMKIRIMEQELTQLELNYKVHMYVCVYVCMCVRVYVCTCVRMYALVRVYVCMCVRVYVCYCVGLYSRVISKIYMHAYILTYIIVYIHETYMIHDVWYMIQYELHSIQCTRYVTHTHIHKHTHTHTHRRYSVSVLMKRAGRRERQDYITHTHTHSHIHTHTYIYTHTQEMQRKGLVEESREERQTRLHVLIIKALATSIRTSSAVNSGMKYITIHYNRIHYITLYYITIQYII
jgi:hypothetical protein